MPLILPQNFLHAVQICRAQIDVSLWPDVLRVPIMRALFPLVVALLLAVSSCTLAQDSSSSSSSSSAALLATLPSCAVCLAHLRVAREKRLTAVQLTCLVAGIEESPCAITNQTCVCTDAPLQTNVAACVSQNCTIKQALCMMVPFYP
jgi:hypothetical protein